MSSQKLKNWVKRLKTKNMPVLGSVIAELNKITESDESGAAQLAEVILRDPNLTSHVLRVANSVQFNYSQQQINTISRAIVLIGLKGVRAICISLLVLDRMLKGKSKEHVLKLVAQGFHAAVQAQSLVQSKTATGKHAEDEPVFIAALLFNLGEMAFWLSEELCEEKQALLSSDPKVRKQAQNDLLGGSFKGLTQELAEQWKLGDTLVAALKGDVSSDGVKAVITGERISRAALYGWDSPQFKKVLTEVAEFQGVSIDEALRSVKRSADKASEVALSYGAPDACPMIPSSVDSAYFVERSPSSQIMQPDPKLQLSVLRELNTSASGPADVNMIFQTLLEGLHRGVGLERVAVAFIKAGKANAKYALGQGTETWRERFRFDANPYSDTVFSYALEQGDSCWLDSEFVQEHEELYAQDLRDVLGRLPCLLYTIYIANKPKAIVYADRAFFGGRIDAEQFESFRHFCSQAKLCLNTLSNSH
ncbi:HDOD domain-containing protein [Agaribacterium sp. ZY112]|uniref:HDOD domain-containing protein n=1 Tax=Agaribacterium sp. ZY112 TaxID=3233574 RepID=UPI003526506A